MYGCTTTCSNVLFLRLKCLILLTQTFIRYDYIYVVDVRKKENMRAESTALAEERKHVMMGRERADTDLFIFFLYFLVVLTRLFAGFVFTVLL